MDAGLADKTVLITGASGGIGLVTARAFADEGAGLLLHYHTHPGSVRALCKELHAPCRALQADLRDEQQVEAAFSEALQHSGRIDVLVANAGIWNPNSKPAHEMSLQQWQETLTTDLTSVFLTCRAFLRHLAARPREHAAIVLVGSTAAIFGEAGHADYAAAKAGLAYGLTLSLKNEIVQLASRGRVNCVCPGWTATPMAGAHTQDAEALRRSKATMALDKIATPEDIANTIVFLSSDTLAGHISGAIIPVTGGMEGRLLRPAD